MKSKRLATLACVLVLCLIGLSVATPVVRADTFTVTSTADTGTGSLRWAIDQANSKPGRHTITFSIPTSDGGFSLARGVWTIQPASSLPTLTGETTIDGSTQTEWMGDANRLGPEIELDGSKAGGLTVGLDIHGNQNQVRSLIINRFAAAGIHISQGMTNTVSGCYIGTDHTGTVAQPNDIGVYVVDDASWNIIGGTVPEQRNLISGNSDSGLRLEGVEYNDVWGNYIGTDRTGSSRLPNGTHGVHVLGGAEFNDVGGELPEYGNLISGNNGHGVYIEGSNTMINRVGGNTIGLNASHSAPLHNGKHGVGLYDGTVLNQVGSSVLQPNVIGDNAWSGVAIVDSHTNAVFGNTIGLPPAGATQLGNGYHGVHIYDGVHNAVSSNSIAYNGTTTDGNGVRVQELGALYNRITVNSIHHNGGLGIALVTGGNAGLAAPQIIGASCSGASGTACANSTVEIFSDSQDEGQQVHFPPVAFADAAGKWSWSGSITGPNVTATAADGLGNTSQFSTPRIGACYRMLLPQLFKSRP